MKKAGQVVVFRFPQADLAEGKLGPALLLVDILPCLKAGDSCSWFCERTYFIRLPL